jgi:hypothetical protein
MWFTSDRHLKPVEFFFHYMEGIVTDLVVVPHLQDGLSGCLKRGPMGIAVRGTGRAGSIVWSKVCRKVLAHGFRVGRVVAFERCESRT